MSAGVMQSSTPRSAGATGSLAAAVAAAAVDPDSYVLFFSASRDAMSAVPPHFPDDVPAAVLKQIVIRYPSPPTHVSLCAMMASLQMEQSPTDGVAGVSDAPLPCAIIVDDLDAFVGDFAPGSNEHLVAIAKTCAQLQNLQAFINTKAWARRRVRERRQQQRQNQRARSRSGNDTPASSAPGAQPPNSASPASSDSVEVGESSLCDVLLSYTVAPSVVAHFGHSAHRAVAPHGPDGGGRGDGSTGWDGSLPGVTVKTLHRWFPMVCLLDKPHRSAATSANSSGTGAAAAAATTSAPALSERELRVLMANTGVRGRTSELEIPV